MAAGCTGSSASNSAPVETTAPTTTAVVVEANDGPSLDDIDWQVEWDGVGPIRVGTTFEEIAEAVGPGFEIGEEEVLGEGLGGHAVSLDGEVLLYFGTYEPENPIFEILVVESERLSLGSGLRLGMTLAEAADLHGEPALWFHTTSHGREGVSFADGTGDSDETIHLGSTGVDTIHAGQYGDPEPDDQDLFRTTDYDPAGTISTISVLCFGPGRQSCPPPT